MCFLVLKPASSMYQSSAVFFIVYVLTLKVCSFFDYREISAKYFNLFASNKSAKISNDAYLHQESINSNMLQFLYQ